MSDNPLAPGVPADPASNGGVASREAPDPDAPANPGPMIHRNAENGGIPFDLPAESDAETDAILEAFANGEVPIPNFDSADGSDAGAVTGVDPSSGAPADPPLAAAPVPPEPGSPAGEGGTPSPSGDPQVDPQTVEINGQSYTAEQLARMAELDAWAAQITREQALAMDALLSGQYQLAPVDPATGLPPVGVPPAASGSGSPVPQPASSGAVGQGTGQPLYDPYTGQPLYPQAPPPPNPTYPPAPYGQPGYPPQGYPSQGFNPAELEQLAPGLASYLGQMQAQQAALQAQVQQSQALSQQMAQAQADQARIEAERLRIQQDALITAGQQSFKNAHPDLTDDDLTNLTQTVASLQILPALVQQNNNDIAAAVQTGLEHALWTNPDYRARMLEAEQARIAQQSQEVNQRKRNAAAVSGASGSVPRTPPTPAVMTREQADAAMVAELEAHMSGQPSPFAG